MQNEQLRDLIMEDLKKSDEIIPEKYDGSYVIVPKAVEMFSTLPNNILDYTDMNALWFLCVDTFKCGIDVKKKHIENSHLSKSRKKELINFIDEIWNKNINGEFSLYMKSISDPKQKVGMGMFGTGFQTFKNRANTKTISRFIQMSIDISKMDNDEDMFNCVEDFLLHEHKGIGYGTLSQFLHCLKPYTFPIINGKMGEGISLYEILGIELEKPNNINFITNVRKIYDFRNKNFIFKNFRIMDNLSISKYNDIVLETADIFQSGKEGKKKVYYTTHYERNLQNREEAIKFHGTTCCVCGFNFEDFYGDYGKGYIEIHHIVPLHSLDEEVTINPKTDLIPLCANCHRIIHRGINKTLTIQELKNIVMNKKNSTKIH